MWRCPLYIGLTCTSLGQQGLFHWNRWLTNEMIDSIIHYMIDSLMHTDFAMSHTNQDVLLQYDDNVLHYDCTFFIINTVWYNEFKS